MEGFDLLQAVLTVLSVLLLAYWFSRLLGKRWVQSSGTSNIKVIDGVQVGQDRRVLLIQVGEHNYLVGVSQAGIQLLAEVEGNFEAAKPSQPNPGAQLPFQELMEKYLTAPPKKGGRNR